MHIHLCSRDVFGDRVYWGAARARVYVDMCKRICGIYVNMCTDVWLIDRTIQ